MRTTKRVLSELELRVLPSWFFSWPCDFLDQCIRDPGMLSDLADALFEDAGIRNPFPRDSFAAEQMQDDSARRIVRLTFPVPGKSSARHCAYAVWNKASRSADYRFCGLSGSRSLIPPEDRLSPNAGTKRRIFSGMRRRFLLVSAESGSVGVGFPAACMGGEHGGTV